MSVNWNKNKIRFSNENNFVFFCVKIDEPGVNDGTLVAQSSNARVLDSEIEFENSTEIITDAIISDELIPKKMVEIEKNVEESTETKNIENDENKSIRLDTIKKSREKRGILSTFISRKKFYKLLRHKLDGLVLIYFSSLITNVCH